MLSKKKTIEFQSSNISKILLENFSGLMLQFYEMQTSFLKKRYKVHKSLHTSNIIICLIKNVHLAIVRQRERYLDFDISLNNFWNNLNKIEIDSQKIVSIVKTTSIPKETVRRKIEHLINKDYIITNKESNRGYLWNLTQKRKDAFIKIMQQDIFEISKFVAVTTQYLNLNLSNKIIKEEIETQFSFYYYHFLNCQLLWLKMWKEEIKDVDLIFIAIQALIPKLKYSEESKKNINYSNVHSIIGATNNNYSHIDAISASSISQVTGMPRATCIRKIKKLVNLGMLVQENKTKRYLINQNTSDRTKHITKKENISFTIEIFSEFLTIVINALLRNQQKKY